MEVHASLKAEDIFLVGPVAITNSMVMSWITIVIIAAIGIAAGRSPKLVPAGVQNFFEFIVEALMGLVESTAGHYSRRVFPLIATLFIYILLATPGGLRPVDGKKFPLAQASEAHQAVLAPGAYGKIVLIP